MLEKSEPPQTKRRSKEFWREAVDHLKANPGDWFVLGEWSSSVAGQMRRGAYTSFVPDDISPDKRAEYMKYAWEFHSEMCGPKNDKGYRNRAVLRARYIGG